jgi:hypothetical protein
MLLAFKNQTRQSARHIGSGIDVDRLGNTSRVLVGV